MTHLPLGCKTLIPLTKNEDTPAHAAALVSEVIPSGDVALLEDLWRLRIVRVGGKLVGDIEPLAGRVAVPVLGAGENHLDKVYACLLEAVQGPR